MKKIILSALLAVFVVAAIAFAEFFPTVIVTGIGGKWVDTRAYTTIAAAVTAIGGNERVLIVIGEEAVGTLTIPVNVRLKFLSAGSLAVATQLTLQTFDIGADSRQIFSGAGDIDFPVGAVVKSSWFADLDEALDVTSDDTLTMVISEAETLTADAVVGDDVILRWESPLIITSTGFNLTGLKKIEAGTYQIFGVSAADDFDFLAGSVVHSSWFNRIRTAITTTSDEDVNLTILVDQSETIGTNTTLDIHQTLNVLPGCLITVETGDILAVDGNFKAGITQAFILVGTGTVVFGGGGVREAYPQWFGAVADGVTDNEDAINDLANACRINAIPIYFSPGEYYTTGSLNFSNANNDNVGYKMGWKIYGAGPESSQITGHLGDAHCIVDLTDNEQSLLSDIRIEGDAGGGQICGVLHGMVGTGLALENKLYNVTIGGTFSEAGYIDVGADLTRIDHCYISGPIGTLFTADRDALGVGLIHSDFNTLYTSGEGTQQYITNSSIIGIGGDTNNWDSAVVLDEVEKVSMLSSYIAQDGTAKAGILISGTNGVFYDVHKLDFTASRYENQSDAPEDGVFIWVASADGLRDSIIDGYVGGNGSLPDLGQIIYLGGGSLHGSTLKIATVAANDWTHFVQRGAAETIYNCELFEQVDDGTMLDGLDAAIFGPGNVIHLRSWNANWMNVADRNIFFTDDLGIITVNPWAGYNSVGTTTSLARRFVGHIATQSINTYNTAAAGDETLGTYTLPGYIGFVNTSQNRVNLKIIAYGIFTGNANAKTLKAKFGVQGAETTLITNDITANPNGKDFILEVNLLKMSLTDAWHTTATLTVGSVVQTVNFANVAADPDTNTVNFIITADAVANDVLLVGMRQDLF